MIVWLMRYGMAMFTKPAETQALALNQAQGYVSKIEVQDCNTFLK